MYTHILDNQAAFKLLFSIKCPAQINKEVHCDATFKHVFMVLLVFNSNSRFVFDKMFQKEKGENAQQKMQKNRRKENEHSVLNDPVRNLDKNGSTD